MHSFATYLGRVLPSLLQEPRVALDTVTYVSPRYPPYVGGVETHVRELSTRAKARYGNVSVVTTDPSGQLARIERDDGPTIYRIRSFAPRENYHFPVLSSLMDRLRICNPEILHIHNIHDLPGPIAGLISRGRPVIFTTHFTGGLNSLLGRISFQAYRVLIRAVIKRVSRVVCVSRFESRLVLEAFPEAKGKIVIIPNGVDPELFTKFRWSDPAEPVILYVGRLETYKNVDKIITALSLLRKSHDRLRLVVVGKGPEKAALLRLAEKLGVASSVEWLEGLERSNLYKLYSSASVLVLPSGLEAFGLVAAEAISVGVPTIVANSSALSEFADAGLALPVGPSIDGEKIASRISQVLEDPKTFSPRRKTSDLIASWEEVAKTTFSLYDSLM